MDQDAGAFPEPGSPAWMRVQSHPDVDTIETVGGTVRVRLVSGVELEWKREDVPADNRSQE